MNAIRIFTAVAFAGLVTAAPAAQTDSAASTANPELVGALAKELGSTPKQAEGAAGALFGLAKSKLAPTDWTKVASSVSGMDGLLKAAPAMAAAGGGAIPGAANLGSLASMASVFSKLGLKPDMVMKAVPILTKFVTKSGGADVGKLLASVLK
jgi:hypothetical protein